MPDPELAEAMIAAAMTRAEQRVCGSDPRCYAFPDRLKDARETCTLKGRCKVGWIARAGGRATFDVWVDVATGLAKLLPGTDA